MQTPLDVAIVGGGITGLAAAYELQRRGCSVRETAVAGPTGSVSSLRLPGLWLSRGARIEIRDLLAKRPL